MPGASGSGKVVPPKLMEADARDVVKGLWEGADLESLKHFVYPFYRVELARKRGHMQVWLDGRTGKKLPA